MLLLILLLGGRNVVPAIRRVVRNATAVVVWLMVLKILANSPEKIPHPLGCPCHRHMVLNIKDTFKKSQENEFLWAYYEFSANQVSLFDFKKFKNERRKILRIRCRMFWVWIFGWFLATMPAKLSFRSPLSNVLLCRNKLYNNWLVF